MANGVFVDNDQSDDIVIGKHGAHVSYGDNFGGGTVHVEKRIGGQYLPVYKDGVAVTATAADDIFVDARPSDILRVRLAGATAPNLVWSITE